MVGPGKQHAHRHLVHKIVTLITQSRSRTHHILAVAVIFSRSFLFLYTCLNWYLPMVPQTTTPTPKAVQTAVTIRPTGKMPSVVPGMTNGVGLMEVREAAPTGDPAKMPFTKDASFELSVVDSSRSPAPVAVSVTFGASRVTSCVLMVRSAWLHRHHMSKSGHTCSWD